MKKAKVSLDKGSFFDRQEWRGLTCFSPLVSQHEATGYAWCIYLLTTMLQEAMSIFFGHSHWPLCLCA